MKKENSGYKIIAPASDLRRRAEKLAQGKEVPLPDYLESLSPENARQAIHELHVHQIELEMQNEELRRTQMELKVAQERYFDLYNLAPVGYFTLSESGLVLEANLTACSLLGLPRGAMINQSITRFIFKDDQDIYYLHHKNLIGTGDPQTCELRMVKVGGTQFWAHLSVTAIAPTLSLSNPSHGSEKNGAPACRVIISDITERKLAAAMVEKRLVTLTQPLENGSITFDQLFNLADVQRLQDEFAAATGVASIITHPDGTPLTASSNFTCLCSEIIRKTGKGCANCYKSDAAIGRYHPEGPIVQPCLSGGLWDAGASITVGGHHIANWLIGQVRDETQTEEKMRSYAREIGADESVFMEAFRLVPAMSRQRFEGIAKVLFTLANQLSTTAYQNIQQARAIAQLKQAEKALYLKNFVFDASLAANSIANLEGNLTEVNNMFLRIWGYANKNEVIGKPVMHFFADPHEAIVILNALNKKGQCEGDFTAQRKDGSTFIAHAQATIVRDESGKMIGYQSSVIDVTERLQIEAELHKAQKLNSIGILAGGIAHDFNNILMGLFGNISLAKKELPKNHHAIQPLENAEKAMARAILLTKQLLTFAKGGDPITEDVSLGTFVEEVAQFDLTGSNVLLVHHQADDLWMAKADKGQIQQVISNLTTNAREAMPNGGHLYITLENAILPTDTPLPLPPGKYIKIIIQDEGTGIDQKCLEQIFDPFFTTKQSGRGLGLSTTYSIIKRHSGHIGVISEMGKGTTFTLYLPASEAELSPPKKQSIAKPFTARPKLKILVLDDEEFIRMVIPRWLKQMNCFVETSADGRQTIDLYKQALRDGAPFDLVILDLTIPGGIGGLEVMKEILALDPHAKAIVSSGYAEGPIMANFAIYGFKGVLAKPYTEDQLQELVKQVLPCE